MITVTWIFHDHPLVEYPQLNPVLVIDFIYNMLKFFKNNNEKASLTLPIIR